ncbi:MULTISPECIES: LCP family protein [Eubacterium]|uniref:Cell envelope-related function transcriptional attenuator common domain-containing protein n=1 Tax=Eubacterium barkeri TaxID=1528 RepID=A0A1H3CQK2_EUBBA|nr:LCP family protein [Eubacterium barkeri]SDX55834.1 cell envelope-related function transcriptional attenuator common domain-containing protein [Eubacterium barkeri]
MKEPKKSRKSGSQSSHGTTEMKAPRHYDSGKKKKHIGLIIAGIILLLFLITGLIVYSKVHSTIGQINQVSVDTNDLDATTDNRNVVNIALYGIDTEEGGTGRSDAIMILTIDPDHKVMKLTSIMRDSYVNIEDHGMDKINHAYAFGGPELAIKTLNQNFGLNITDFMAVDFTSMPVIIDQLGGVDIEITPEEAATGQIPGISEAGTRTLSGEQALAYSRIRYASGNDFKRTERQRTVLNQLMIGILKQPMSTWPDLISQLAPYITTNLSTNDIIGLSTAYGPLAKQGIQQMRFPRDGEGEGQYIDGVYYLVFDIPTVSKELQDYLFYDIDPQ